MREDTPVQLFEAKKIRCTWSEEDQKWYFSIVDVVEALTGTDRPRKYWNDLKSKLKKEGSQLFDFFVQLKIENQTYE